MGERGGLALRINLRLFAGYRERIGRSEMTVDLPEGATVGILAAEVARGYPGLIGDPARLVVAVNQEYRDHLHVLREGDEAALIPPVSGGVDDRD